MFVEFLVCFVIEHRISFLLHLILLLQEFDQSFKNCIGEFVVELLVRLYDSLPPPSSSSSFSSSFLAKYFKVCDPAPLSPHYSSRVITATLDYLPTCYNAVGSSFISLLSKKKEKVHSLNFSSSSSSSSSWFLI